MFRLGVGYNFLRILVIIIIVYLRFPVWRVANSWMFWLCILVLWAALVGTLRVVILVRKFWMLFVFVGRLAVVVVVNRVTIVLRLWLVCCLSLLLLWSVCRSCLV